MATAESVKAKIRGLIDAANSATGSTDADLTTAVSTLVDGYGKGSGDEDTEAMKEKLDFYERYIRAQYGYSFEDWNPYVNEEGTRVITVNTRGIEYTVEEPPYDWAYGSISIYPEFNIYALNYEWLPSTSYMMPNSFMNLGRPINNPRVMDLSRVTNYNTVRNKIIYIQYNSELAYGATVFAALPDYCYAPYLGSVGEEAYSLGISFGLSVQSMNANSIAYSNLSYSDKPVYVMEGFTGNLYLAKLNISAEHLIGIINNLGEGSYTLNIGSHNMAKLTAEQIQIATDKGWTVS